MKKHVIMTEIKKLFGFDDNSYKEIPQEQNIPDNPSTQHTKSSLKC